MVPEVLEMAQLVDDHGMAQVQVRGRGIHPQLDPELAPGLQLPDKFFLDEEFLATALDRL